MNNNLIKHPKTIGNIFWVWLMGLVFLPVIGLAVLFSSCISWVVDPGIFSELCLAFNILIVFGFVYMVPGILTLDVFSCVISYVLLSVGILGSVIHSIVVLGLENMSPEWITVSSLGVVGAISIILSYTIISGKGRNS